jgi:sulfonate dioxygenase
MPRADTPENSPAESVNGDGYAVVYDNGHGVESKGHDSGHLNGMNGHANGNGAVVRKPIISYDINLPYVRLLPGKARTLYPDYLPSWEPVWYDKMPIFPYLDPALRVANMAKVNLIGKGVTVSKIQPRMGSIVNGVQLNKLSNAQKDELALLISERKVVVFPDQDLIDDGPAAQSEFMRYFGKLNFQPVSGTVKGFPGFHIIHRDGNKEEIARFFSEKATSTLWHQDVSYEHQPPGYVMLGLLQGPDVGGDTVFAATDEAYK